MTNSVHPEDFRTYSRGQAIMAMEELDAQNEPELDDLTDYYGMTNEQLEAELCLSGIVHDEDMKGVYDTVKQAEAALAFEQASFNG